ncbi:MAG: SDR family oxidoreductase [Deltaproteobacteria bacterium]|nr:SDR family oxidoreductase [Deltaproteobacteria bacterium]
MARNKRPVVLVTGGTSGIGLAVLHHFARKGYDLAFCGRNVRRGEKAVADIRKKYSSRVLFVPGDVSKEEAVERVVKEGPGRLGRLDVLCNNAGIQKISAIQDLSPADWDEVMSVNARGAFLITRLALPYLKKSKGSIVNVASTGGLMGYAGGSAYCVSKAALVMLTKVLALELAPFKVRVNCICPGAVDTPMVPSKSLKSVASRIPLRRVGRSEEIAELVYYLSSQSAKQITGGTFVVDGGVTAGRPRLAPS